MPLWLTGKKLVRKSESNFMFKTIKLFIIAISLSVSFSSFVLAQDDEAAKVALAEKLVSETVTSSFLKEMFDSTWPTLKGQVAAKNPDVSEDILNELRDVLAQQQKELVASLIVDLPKAYAKYFTLEELEKVYEFQTSDVGKKVVSVQPKIMAEFMPRILQSIQGQMPKVLENFQNAVREKGLNI